MCGEDFIGETFKVYDENNRLQKGLVSCGCHMDVLDDCCQICKTPLNEPGICSPCAQLKMKIV